MNRGARQLHVLSKSDMNRRVPVSPSGNYCRLRVNPHLHFASVRLSDSLEKLIGFVFVGKQFRSFELVIFLRSFLSTGIVARSHWPRSQTETIRAVFRKGSRKIMKSYFDVFDIEILFHSRTELKKLLPTRSSEKQASFWNYTSRRHRLRGRKTGSGTGQETGRFQCHRTRESRPRRLFL